MGISSSEQLPNTLRANSKLNIDWIHDLFYWTKESSIAIVFKSFFSLNFSGLIVREDIKSTNFILQLLESTFNNNIFEDFIFPSVMQILERRRDKHLTHFLAVISSIYSKFGYFCSLRQIKGKCVQ